MTGAVSAVDGRRTDRALFVFYAAVALIALAGQTGAAVQWLHWALPFALAAVAAAEFGGIVLSAYADHRRRLGEHAIAARALSGAVAAGAVAVNWLGHRDHLQGGFFAGMSALGYGVWLLHSGARRRDQLRKDRALPPTAPVYGWWAWLRHPGITARARALALADPTLGLYGSLAASRTAVRTEQRQASIAALLRRKLAVGRDRLAADIAVAVYDLDQIAARLAAGADYDGLTGLIAQDLTPARLVGSPDPTEVMIDSVRTVEQQAVTSPVAVPLSARIPAVALSTIRHALADSQADTTPDRAPDAATACEADRAADSNPDNRPDVQVDGGPDNRADTGADTATPRKRTSGRTATRSHTRTTGRTSGRTPKADIAAAARQLRDRHPEWAVADIAKRLGVTDRTVRRHINGTTNTEGTAP